MLEIPQRSRYHEYYYYINYKRTSMTISSADGKREKIRGKKWDKGEKREKRK